ncbi:hypothetical protein [Baaleninema sp.]|uniref:hypothetical protein n=1 Tax=Baaleninema sp. TaxID=3101197 RepID=UPI003D07C5BC
MLQNIKNAATKPLDLRNNAGFKAVFVTLLYKKTPNLRAEGERRRNPQQFHRVPVYRRRLWKTCSKLWKTGEEPVESLWNLWGKSPGMIRIAKGCKT